MKKVCVMGLGYIGLPTAIVSAESGFETLGFDIDESRVKKIKNYDPVIKEAEIGTRLESALKFFGLRVESRIELADCFIVAVPTPFYEDKTPDLSYVFNACDILATVLKAGDLVLIESTVPVGTTELCAKKIEDKTGLIAGKDFYIAHCPERVLPGRIFYEIVNNSRIIGGINKESVNVAKEFYQKFVYSELYLTNASTAEMVKLVENSSRDVAIAFANQVADMAKSVGLSPYEVIELANKHPRVKILNPSCGVGGHCIAVDPWFLIKQFTESTQLLKSARDINDNRPEQVISEIKDFVKNLKIPKILCLGLTYKQDTDDLRESPALYIARQLSKLKDYQVSVCDPLVSEQALPELNFINLDATNCAQILSSYDLIVCLVSHKEFKILRNFISNSANILDFCGLMHFEKSSDALSSKEYFFWPSESKEKFL